MPLRPILVLLVSTKTRARCMGRHVDREPEPIHDLLDVRLREPSSGDLLIDTLDASAPLLHDPGLTEDARERRIPQPRSAPHRIHRHSRQEQSWAVDLDAVVVETDPYGRPAFGIAGMHESVDDDFTDRLDRNRVSIAPTHLAEHSGLVGVLQQELHDPVHGKRHRTVNLDLIEDVGSACTTQPTALHPRRGQETRGVRTRSEKTRIRWDDLASLLGCEPKRDKIIDIGTAPAQFRQGRQVEVVQRGSWFDHVFERHTASVAFKFRH